MDDCPAVGIDLGTTNSCVAIFRNGKVDVIENDQGPRTTPSCVTFTDDGQVLTGLESMYESHKYLKTTVFEAKRLMGQRFSNPKVQADIERFPYEVFDDLGTPKIRIVSNRKYERGEFSGCILREIRAYAEKYAKGLTSAVAAVPANFSEARRQTAKDNVAIAGFKNIDVIDGHTAAAIAVAHAYRKETKRNLVVYDFGDISFHASLLSVEKAKCVVRGTNGDCHLGGDDIDKNMIDFLKQRLGEDYDNAMDDESTKFIRLKNICKAAKKTLSTKLNVDIELDGFGDNEFRTIPLTRARFEEINRKLFERTIKILDSCLTASGVTKSDIDEVMLVGGSSRIPKIKDMLKEYFGKEIIKNRIKPDEAIARGAAIHAANLPENEDKMDTQLVVGIDLEIPKPCVAFYRTGKVDEFWITFTKFEDLTELESLGKFLEYLNPTIFEAKMRMCQRLSDTELQADVKRCISKDICNYGTLKITTVSTKEYYPEDISAYILSKMRAHAEKRKKGVTKAVVTVPAYFNESQRQATKDAAAIAGFKNITVINEPTAAAIAFIHENQKDYKRNLLVYDFGGGTFDVSVVTVDKTNCTVRATNGDCHLGGTDIDMNMVRFLKYTLGLDDNKDMEVDEYQPRRLKNKCEAAKKKLSSEFHVDIELDAISNMDFPTITLSRARFEQMNGELFEKTITILDECLTASGILKSDIEEVILVGGSSRIPKIKEMLIEYFGKDIINNAVNPDEAVAYGAAIYAANLPGNKIEVVDVTALSLGTNTYGDCLSVIIPRNTPLPAKAIKRYQTIIDNQTLMEFPIYQGEREIASENFEVANFTMTDLTEAPAKAVKVEVCYNYDYEGLLHITATEINSGKTKALTIDMEKKGLSQQQIEERIKDAERNRENDIKKRKFQEDRYYLENLLGKVKKHAEKCSVEDKKILDGKYDSIYKWLDKAQIGELETIEEYKKELEALIAKTRLKNS